MPFSACFQLVSKLKSEAASTLSLMFQIFLEKNYRTPWLTLNLATFINNDWFYYFIISQFFSFSEYCVFCLSSVSVECRPNLNFREIKTGKIQFNIIMGVTSHQESYAMQHRTSTLYLVSQLQHQKVEDFISRPHCHHHKFSH